MKCFPKTVRQCFVTALLTSTLLESYALPLQSAPSSIQSGEGTAAEEAQPTSATERSSVQPIPTVEPASPEASATLAQPSAVNSPAASNPAAPEPATQATPDQLTPATPNGAGSIAPPENIAPPAHPATATTQIETIRQALAAQLAEIVERDRPLRESQLRQNLVAAALHYAQAGEIDRARQTAQNPALPIDLQTETLAKIDAIAAISPQLAAPSAPSTVAIVPTPRPSIAQAPVRWVLPAPPEWGRFGSGNGQSPIGQQCLPRLAAAPLPLSAGAMPQTTLPKTPEAQLQPFAIPEPIAANQFVSPIRISPTKMAVPEKTAVAQKAEWSERNAKTATRQPTLGSANQAMSDRVSSDSSPLAQPDRVSATPLPVRIDALGWQTNVTRDEDFLGVAMPIALIEVPAVFAAFQPDAIANFDFSIFSVLPAAVRMPTFFAAGANFSHALFSSGLASPSVHQTVSIPATPRSDSGALMETGADGCSELPQIPLQAADSLLARSLSSLGMMFPLPIPAAITSLFGWRIHPITGTRRFHTGVDLGAPMGTPILAALPGRVVVADYEGGYGLMVVLENRSATERNLYGHLSAIAVHPGDTVAQGSIIGWVGSTGNSTGPHLHFETQLPVGGTWQAVNPIATTTASR